MEWISGSVVPVAMLSIKNDSRKAELDILIFFRAIECRECIPGCFLGSHLNYEHAT